MLSYNKLPGNNHPVFYYQITPHLTMPNTKAAVLLISVIFCLLLGGCQPTIKAQGKPVTNGYLLDELYITGDGSYLPLSIWPTQNQPASAILIALHGFNDYRKFFHNAGHYFQTKGYTSYAYDQRGFGGSSSRGDWSGVDAYVEDLALFVRLIRQRHPIAPIYLIGESMGGAIVISTLARYPKLPVSGIILAAPAIWARETMPWYQQGLLWSLAHTVPDLTLTGEGMEIQASDNIDMLIALGQDPLVIKKSRVAAIYGLTNLMDSALHNASNLNTNTLLLYGQKDEVIPVQPTCIFYNDIPLNPDKIKTLAYYNNGYHMLLRDLQAPQVYNDIHTWIINPKQQLPSGADLYSRNIYPAK